MRIQIDHTTHYRYDAPLRYSTQYLRKSPPSNAHQRVIEWKLDTPGTPIALKDGFGNIVHLLTVAGPVSDIVIRATGVVETSATIDEARDEVSLSPLVFLRSTLLTRAESIIVELAEQHRMRAGMLSGLRELAGGVLARLPFVPGVTAVHYTAADALQEGCGVCQDHAHVFVACARYLGIPARYVSGYVYSPDSPDGPVASHAWAEAWVVDRWRSFDVTNGGPAGEQHIRVAVGADYLDASPVRGVRRGGGIEEMIASALVSSQ